MIVPRYEPRVRFFMGFFMIDQEPAFLEDDAPADPPPFITTTNARELYDLRPGETVADAAARKARENESLPTK
ncbi:hypothetical protein CWN22_24510 [Klebsiella pneumoniae]|nr:hypothetical protein CWN22_24510 [Klebsiella pneumoniae]